MDFDQIVSLLTALGDFGNLLSGAGDILNGLVAFGGSVSQAAAAS